MRDSCANWRVTERVSGAYTDPSFEMVVRPPRLGATRKLAGQATPQQAGRLSCTAAAAAGRQVGVVGSSNGKK